MRRHWSRHLKVRGAALPALLLAAFALALTGCNGDDGAQGPAGPPGPPGPPGSGADGSVLQPTDPTPGVDVTILDVGGATGANGNFQPGDTFTVHFAVKRDDGTNWDLGQLNRGRALVSGPTFNYQRVLAEQDVLVDSVAQSDGSYTYSFPVPFPDAYLAPLNDSDAFGPNDGELQGQPLLGGTYTVGMYFRWAYTVDGQGYYDVGDATFDFLLGGATDVATRAVVAQANCNQCHQTLQAHGGQRRNVTLCLLCHTAGAEDRNVPSVAGGTPGASIEFSVMVHKIHTGKHLPSVLGVGTNSDGSRNYTVEPKPYELVGFNNNVIDFSEVGFPVWPALNFPLPRDAGYSMLSTDAKAKEDSIRSGPAACATCHGDPDGDGPIGAPAQGAIIYSQLKRRTCGACHDDVDWTRPYTSNTMTMPEQNDDSACTLCHDPTGTSIAVMDGHVHPMTNPSFNPGIEIALLSVGPGGPAAGTGNVQAGDRLQVSFTARDSSGADVPPATLGNVAAVVSGPTNNLNLVLNTSIPSAALTGSQPYTIDLPERVYFEPLGVATGGTDVFVTQRAPHWNVSGATTDVFARTGTSGGDSTLSAPVTGPANYVDVVSASGFARNDYVVIEGSSALGGPPPDEYLQIQWVDGNRLWFSSPYTPGYAPGPRHDYLAGDAVREVQLAGLASGTNYTLDAPSGTITEVSFTTGQTILVSYTSDFLVPDVYPLALNHSPDLDDASGRWTGKSLVDGTYTVGLWGGPTLTLMQDGESNSYRGTAKAVTADFLVGAATTIEPYSLIDSEATCLACHQDVYFHGGGRRGVASCLLCHGTAGSEDRPRYVAPGAPDTTGLTINFRTMLHKIHHGAELANASTYAVVGFGSTYPNNYSLATYSEVEFPAFPSGTKDCASCHGDANTAWQQPAPRNHPTEQVHPTQVWTVTCGSCHDSDAVQAHIAVQTAPNGAESCAVCHGTGKELSPEVVHRIR